MRSGPPSASGGSSADSFDRSDVQKCGRQPLPFLRMRLSIWRATDLTGSARNSNLPGGQAVTGFEPLHLAVPHSKGPTTHLEPQPGGRNEEPHPTLSPNRKTQVDLVGDGLDEFRKELEPARRAGGDGI